MCIIYKYDALTVNVTNVIDTRCRRASVSTVAQLLDSRRCIQRDRGGVRVASDRPGRLARRHAAPAGRRRLTSRDTLFRFMKQKTHSWLSARPRSRRCDVSGYIISFNETENTLLVVGAAALAPLRLETAHKARDTRADPYGGVDPPLDAEAVCPPLAVLDLIFER